MEYGSPDCLALFSDMVKPYAQIKLNKIDIILFMGVLYHFRENLKRVFAFIDIF